MIRQFPTLAPPRPHEPKRGILPALVLPALVLTGTMALSGAAIAQSEPSAVPGEEHCVVNVAADDRLNLRSGPGNRYRILTGLRYGQCGVIVTSDCRGNWCPVEDGHYRGFVHRRFIAMVSPARYCIAGLSASAELPLRAWPASDSRILTRLTRGDCGIAFLPYATGGWQKVRFEGREGWLPRRFLSGQ